MKSEIKNIPVAIIEDDVLLRQAMVLNLSQRGMAPSAFSDGAAFDAAIQDACPWRVLLLDLGLPGEDGLSIARRLRKSRPELGIIMLSGRGALAERVEGMREGADIYLVKPVEADELEAAIRSVARRLDQAKAPARTWLLNAVDMQLIAPTGNAITLNYTETQLLQTFGQSPDCICGLDALILAIGKEPATYDPRALKVMISRLRKKLGDKALIKSTYACGYVFAGKISLLADS
jgi:DNA-binding response OmpR family regulator